jgi:hypothetical protein
MAEYAYPMDSKVTYNGNGIPSFDRAVTSAQLRGMISEIITNGVLMANNSNALRVIANGDKSVTIQPGLCVINGAIKKFTEAKTMQLPVSADTNYRGIAICALFDLTNRDIRLVYYNTYPAESATDLIPLNGKDGIDRTDTRYAIQLANIYTAPGSTRIVQSDITDTRLDTERCGAVSSISQFDTTNLYNQIQSDLASFKSTEQAEFQEWFENLQTVLDSNTAAHLQNEIDGLNSSKANKSDITNINITGTTNNTGSNIFAGTLFYLNGTLCRALVDVANGATFTDGTNYSTWSIRQMHMRLTHMHSTTNYYLMDNSFDFSETKASQVLSDLISSVGLKEGMGFIQVINGLTYGGQYCIADQSNYYIILNSYASDTPQYKLARVGNVVYVKKMLYS